MADINLTADIGEKSVTVDIGDNSYTLNMSSTTIQINYVNADTPIRFAGENSTTYIKYNSTSKRFEFYIEGVLCKEIGKPGSVSSNPFT